ncbi:hypothetical protein HOY82DRAFT_606469 [Tuber indicum]|nr:hypothetical protein HOY82DRAFT_606469 [Tuber indicum]
MTNISNPPTNYDMETFLDRESSDVDETISDPLFPSDIGDDSWSSDSVNSDSQDSTVQNPVDESQEVPKVSIERLQQFLHCCTCSQQCTKKANPEVWSKWLSYHDSLSKYQKKIMITYLLSPQLSSNQQVLQGPQIYHVGTRPCKRLRWQIKYLLPFVSTVCQNVFQMFWNISRGMLYALIHNLRESQMPIPRTHGNLMQVPHNKIADAVTEDLIAFLSKLKEEEGEAIATGTYKRTLASGALTRYMELETIVYLPSHLSYRIIYQQFLTSNHLDVSKNPISFSKFYRTWKSDPIHRLMKIRKPSKNVCDECTILKNWRLPQSPDSPESEEISIAPSANLLKRKSIEEQLELHRK